MKVGIVGLGGVGGYYGALLARRYARENRINIVFLARGNHLTVIRERGLEVITPDGKFTVVPDLATDDPADCGELDLLLFCVKAYDLEGAAEMMKSTVNENTAAITLLNGVDNAGRLKAILSTATVFNGCVYVSSQIEQPGTVRHVGGAGQLFFGLEDGEAADYSHIETLLKDAGIEAEYSRDIKSIVWEKYIFISPLAGATTYLNKTVGQLLDDPVGRQLLTGLVGELELVARAQGVEVADGAPSLVLKKASAFPGQTKTSMQLDFERGKKTEIETFTGYVIKTAGRLGIPTPLHETVYRSLVDRLTATPNP